MRDVLWFVGAAFVTVLVCVGLFRVVLGVTGL